MTKFMTDEELKEKQIEAALDFHKKLYAPDPLTGLTAVQQYIEFKKKRDEESKRSGNGSTEVNQ